MLHEYPNGRARSQAGTRAELQAILDRHHRAQAGTGAGEHEMKHWVSRWLCGNVSVHETDRGVFLEGKKRHISEILGRVHVLARVNVTCA